MKKFVLYFILLFPFIAFGNLNFSKDLSFKAPELSELSAKLTKKVFSERLWPKSVKFNERNYKVSYTIDEKLSKYINRELRRYRSDYAAVVVIDNNNGEVLAATDYTRKTKRFGKNLAFSTTNPAASIFKVVTAADLLENSDINEKTRFYFNGRGTTLYKYQLKEKKNRWTRAINFNKAFAYSNNVVFGKAAIGNTNTENLRKTASKLGFGNKNLLQLLKFGNSEVYSEQGSYALAELASGFNRKTMMSPMHGAILASIVANDGVFRPVSVFKEIKDVELGQAVWRPKFIKSRVISQKSNAQLQDLMELTVSRGTARSAFRPWKMKKVKNIKVGGKTGSITGGFPFGKRDWFVSYAKPDKNTGDKGISVCVMIVNVKKWYIKSTHMAKNVIEYYYSNVKR